MGGVGWGWVGGGWGWVGVRVRVRMVGGLECGDLDEAREGFGFRVSGLGWD